MKLKQHEFYNKIRPMLATLGEPFDSEDYLYEIKWDGIRCIACLGEKTLLKSRNDNDITMAYPELELLHETAKAGVVLDGEIVIFKNGKPSFQEWQKRSRTNMARIKRMAAENPAIFVAFDILFYEKGPLLDTPLIKRKELLEEYLAPGKNLIISQYIPRDGLAFYKAACEQELEGVVAKQKNSTYLPGKRSPAWMKFKRKISQDFIVCGFLPGVREIGSIVLGAYDENHRLIFQGMVGTGIDRVKTAELFKKTEITDKYPFPVQYKELKAVVWVKPTLVCEVVYLEKTSGGLRHPSYIGLRPDKKPEECIYGSED